MIALPVLGGMEVEFEIGEILKWEKWPEANVAGSVINEHSPVVVLDGKEVVIDLNKVEILPPPL